MNTQAIFRSGLPAGCFMLILAGCNVSLDPGTEVEQKRATPSFQYSLRLHSTDDLTRAFAAGQPVDTLGLGLKNLRLPDDTNEPGGRREYVELLKRSNGSSVIRLLLSCGNSGDHDPVTYGELFLVMMDAQGEFVDGAVLHRFECGEDIESTLSMGWHERMIVCNSETDTKQDGNGFATITHLYSTLGARLDGDSIRASREWMATSDIVQGGSALLPMCGLE